MKKELQNLTITLNKKLSDAYFLLELTSDKKLKSIAAGQFAQLEVPEAKEVYLRRPFSIHDVNDKSLRFLIKIVGRGTKKLSALKKGTMISAIFSLGNGFEPVKKGPVLLIGGGCGIAPMLLLAKQLQKKRIKSKLLYGGKNKDEIVQLAEFKKYCDSVELATEDGSKGYKGFVTAALRKIDLKEYQQVYACGPNVMLKNIFRVTKDAGIDLQVSLEEKMACGFGVCLCCVTRTVDAGHVCVCKDGPVFNAEKIAW